MSSERWERTKEILEQALRLAPERRSTYLNSACGADAELRAEVESLIAHHEEAGSQFLGAAAPEVLQLATPACRTPPALRTGSTASGYHDDRDSFVPGYILAERFRIVSLIGRGGMGEVYRADDLELGQPVALKFLPKGALNDPSALERFRSEVRNARRVTHPNVCRVYDIGEYEGRTFLSMEYVDGEDLATLFRRIGRLPATKANEIAQQICAGLAAAHARNVFHRDLKPANILVDGRGQARLTDFGLAIRAGEDTLEIAGTPAYMAPEQFDGAAVTARTDLYSLGIVLYELYTGRRPFEATNFSEWKLRHAAAIPPPPSQFVKDFDSSTEVAILRCLEKPPEKRPPSVVAVSAALPGGNLLAAVLAAGETPSPELVAASGEEGVLSLPRAAALFSSILLGLTLVVFLSVHAKTMDLFAAGKSPDYLVERARELASHLGSSPPAVDFAWTFTSPDAVNQLLASIPAPRRYREIQSIYPSVVQFSYRQSPRPLRRYPDGLGDLGVPAPYYSGETFVDLDADSRLLYFSLIPPQKNDPPSDNPSPDWATFWASSGLSPDCLVSIPPAWAPDFASDRLFSWRGEMRGQPFEVHAASYQGKPVYFQILNSAQLPVRMVTDLTRRGVAFGLAQFAVASLITVSLSVFFAFRNLRFGRGDRRGALRAGFVLFVLAFLSRFLAAHHLADAYYEWWIFNSATGLAAGYALQFCACYLALEPAVRRSWPEMLVSWSRLLAGKFRDPLVGRDLSLGILLGIAQAAIGLSVFALPYFLPVKGITPNFNWHYYVPAREFLSNVCAAAGGALLTAMGGLTIMFLIGKLVRSRALAASFVGLLWTAFQLTGQNWPLEIAFGIAAAALLAFCGHRLGLFALLVQFAVFALLFRFPLSLDFDRWYATQSFCVLLIIVSLALYGLRASLGSRPLLAAEPDSL